MKKGFICFTVASVTALVMLTGCGSAAGTTDNSDSGAAETTEQNTETGETQTASTTAGTMSKYKASDYVTLGEYKGLSVEYNVAEPTDEEVDGRIESTLSNRATESEVTGRPVQTGDIVNIDYVGKKDGVAFDGGTSPDGGYDLTIGSGQFIPGFEDGLIGAKIGQTLDLNLTFPENYGSAELAGADVVFTVTVNAIKEKVTPELTDELAAELDADCKTVADYRAKIKESITAENESNAISNAKNSLVNQTIENATFKEIPDDIITEQAEFRKMDAERYAQNYGTTLEIFVTQGLGETMEQFEAECKEYAAESAKEILVVYAIADAEGLTLSDEEAQAAAEPYLASFQVTSFEQLKDTADGKYFVQFLQADKVMEWLFDNATLSK